MKTFFIWITAGLCVCSSMAAQGYGGRYGGGRGGFGGGGRRGGSQGMRSQSQSNTKDYSQLSITDFPEITGLTLKQKLDLSTAVTNKQKDILKINDQKQELQVKVDHAGSQKDADKYKEKMAKLDGKIQEVSQKTDKKIQAMLTNEQYKEYTEKKSQIKFGTIPKFGSGFRPNPNQQSSDSPERRERSPE
jgi:hypothetical protein